MLIHPTLDQLHALGLHGMAKGFKELDGNPEALDDRFHETDHISCHHSFLR